MNRRLPSLCGARIIYNPAAMTRALVPAAFAVLLPLSLASAGFAATAPADARPRIPVILDTDIGDDIDDTWALALLLRSPELDLKLVVTDYGDTHYRARLVAKLLETAGRSDVPIGVGIRQADRGGPQSAWLGDYPLERYPGKVHADGVKALIDTAMASEEPVTLIAIGPPPNLEAALDREPRLAGRLRFAGMYGSLRRGYGGKATPDPEWNVKAAPAAARAVLGAPWAAAIVTPLDTCGTVQLKGERYARVLASKDPLAKAVVENYRLWCPNQEWCTKDPEHVSAKSSTLFDTVAVYLAFARDLVSVEWLGVSVRDDGLTVPDPAARALDWAVDWKDPQAFEELLASRLAGR
jgi:inosine-uridine nucleoside N-ribohydrolase